MSRGRICVPVRNMNDLVSNQDEKYTQHQQLTVWVVMM